MTEPLKEGDFYRAKGRVSGFAIEGDVFKVIKHQHMLNLFPLYGKYRNGHTAISGVNYTPRNWEKL